MVEATRGEESPTAGVALPVDADGRQRQWLERMLDATHDLLLLIDLEGTIVACNRAAERVFGRAGVPLLGLDALTLFPPAVARERRQHAERARDSAAPVSFHDSHGLMELENTIYPVLDEADRVTHLVIHSRDVTRQVDLHRQLTRADRLASLGLLAGGVAHEINNPLTCVLLDLQELVDRLGRPGSIEAGDCGAMRELVEEALEGVARVQGIVQDLEAFAREEALQPLGVRVDDAVKNAARIAHATIKYRATLVTELGETPQLRVRASSLSQLVTNLLMNAAHAIEPGDVAGNRILVRTWAEAGKVHLLVEDTGRGIEQVHLPRLFDAFFTTKQVGEGTGLGLAICHNIVTSLGGEISVESELGRGSRFLVWLPVR